jgi:hypothetical protein
MRRPDGCDERVYLVLVTGENCVVGPRHRRHRRVYGAAQRRHAKESSCCTTKFIVYCHNLHTLEEGG